MKQTKYPILYTFACYCGYKREYTSKFERDRFAQHHILNHETTRYWENNTDS